MTPGGLESTVSTADTTLVADSVTELFTSAVALTMRGRRVSPRGMGTREVLDVRLLLRRPRARLLFLPPARVLNTAFAVAETVWILSGSNDPWIYTYNDRLRRYADDGVLRGAYGPRMRRWHNRTDQLDKVLATLRNDPDSRRAVIQLYDPTHDADGHRDVPCTLGYRFHLRDGRLHMATTMRSQDLWTGLPYDMFAATVLHELMAGWLGVELGDYHHHVDSLHLYDTDVDKAKAVPSDPRPGSELPDLTTPWEGFDDLLVRVTTGQEITHSGWAAMACALASYRRWKDGDRNTAVDLADRIPGPIGHGMRGWYAELATRTQAVSG
ncbi:thymidylate synthase [Thermopolyspora sp. NPDC052614]|uniref:thymidylate synthase n=1 Tax=Thermopolyspora sp. NPDC052614 TaxID=3155682 RepID=UPI00341C9957